MSKEFKNPYLQHGWGKTAEAKRKEQEYNHRYYEQHKRDKWGVGGTGTNRPLARQKNLTEGGNGVQIRGEGLNTGSVGTNQYGRSEVIDAVRREKTNGSSDVINAVRRQKTANEQAKFMRRDQLRREMAARSKHGTRRGANSVNPYKAPGIADNEATKSYMRTATPSPSQIEAYKTVAKNRDRRAASSVARSNAAAESEQARMNASETKIRKRNASIARAEAAAVSAQASQNKASERYKDYEKSGLFKKQEADKRAEAEKNAQYQNRQNEIKKAISKKNDVQSEITSINNTIKRLQKEDPKKNAIKIDSLYKQLDQKKEAYKNMQAYINALNF